MRRVILIERVVKMIQINFKLCSLYFITVCFSFIYRTASGEIHKLDLKQYSPKEIAFFIENFDLSSLDSGQKNEVEKQLSLLAPDLMKLSPSRTPLKYLKNYDISDFSTETRYKTIYCLILDIYLFHNDQNIRAYLVEKLYHFIDETLNDQSNFKLMLDDRYHFIQLPSYLQKQIDRLIARLSIKKYALKKLESRLTRIFSQVSINDFIGVSYLIDSVKTSHYMPEKIKAVFLHLLQTYFKNLDHKYKLKILKRIFYHLPEEDYIIEKALYKKNTGLPEIKNLLLLIQASGPVLQKFFQTYAENFNNPIMRDAFSLLLNKIPYMTRQELQTQLEKYYPNHPYEDFPHHYEDLLLGSGTIADVWKLKNTKTNQYEAVKIKRPDTRSWITSELKSFSSSPLNPSEKSILEHFTYSVLKESNFVNEYDSMAGLKPIFNKNELKIKVVRPSQNSPRNRSIVCMDYIPGLDLFDAWRQFSELDSQEQKENIEQWLHIYNQLSYIFIKNFQQVLIGKRLFDADLHAGNIRVDDKGWMTIIDVGNTYRMEKDEQKYLLRFLISIHTNNVGKAVKNYTKLVKDSQESRKTELDDIFISAFDNKQLSSGLKFNYIITELIDRKFLTPGFLVDFNRTIFLQETTLQKIRNSLNKYGKQLPTADELLQKFFKSHALRVLWKSF